MVRTSERTSDSRKPGWMVYGLIALILIAAVIDISLVRYRDQELNRILLSYLLCNATLTMAEVKRGPRYLIGVIGLTLVVIFVFAVRIWLYSQIGWDARLGILYQWAWTLLILVVAWP